MGVDYSTTVGYGIVLEELPEIISQGNKWIDSDEIQQWLVDNGYEHVEYERCGDWMNGEYIHLFAAKGTVSRLDPMYDEGYRSFEDKRLSHDEGRELYRLCEQFDLAWPGSISWKLTFNVS